jgi:anhydro-N-acetylmuramic acid kinase
MNETKAIGVMSGSSLDGLDISFCIYRNLNNQWDFEFIKGETILFEEHLLEKLKKVRQLGALELARLDIDLGDWIGAQIKSFCQRHSVEADIIGSHGHTVYHNPEELYSIQIGSGQAMAISSGVPVINDFRSKDVLLGGSGAPLVPIGDLLLFQEYDACLNLGGIANVTVRSENKLLAWDVCPCNQVLNAIANRVGLDYDKDGKLAKKGRVLNSWLKTLSENSYYEKPTPKSMSNEWVEQEVLQHLPTDLPDDMSFTFCQLVANKIYDDLKPFELKKVLVSGGGANHPVMVGLLNKKFGKETAIIIPNASIVEFKEAIIFGLMAVLRNINEINVLKSVTGAAHDTSSGTHYEP